ncbi:VOC family protein [Microbacterium sp. zg.Y625]|uniref:VOC family protein n=1 Tax=Microbacterium jiangjiandongii TaxID=3049071 RepID=UPI00214CE4F8|nr:MULTISPECIES: VOC family protein [unclassified Microbacterium]MCR2792863.1 VOC family protein [Microbacterium sp. zg.Y625]MCR2814502.1 VOC family protein [Microbacterium sp. zg.Y843]WIM26835.1 VOC family protein [Microbacterium sp. zg-Y625]
MATLGNVTFYADDPRTLSHFWAGVFGYPPLEWEDPLRRQLLDAGLAEADLSTRALAEDPEGVGPRLFFHHADGPKRRRNRIHLDVQAVPDGRPTRTQLEAEKDRLVALGAEVVRLVDQSWGPWPELYYQLRDPEGNEFCLQ